MRGCSRLMVDRHLRPHGIVGVLVLAAATGTLLACTRTGHVVTAIPAPTPTPSMAVEAPAADGGIAPVSISHPSPGAKDAFRKCQVGDIGGAGMYSFDLITGMGQVPSARDVYHYVPMTGREPELENDGPAWVVQFHGEFPMLKIAETWTDPVCIATADSFGFYAVGVTRQNASDITTTPEPPPIPPDRTLPPLVP